MTASPTRRHRLAAVLVASLAAIPAALAVAPAAVGSTAAHRAAASTTGGQLPGSAVHTVTRFDPSHVGHGAVAGANLSAYDRAKTVKHSVVSETAGTKVVKTQAFAPGPANSVPTATFVVTYVTGSGFQPAQQTAFQAALDIWARVINAPQPITVHADFEPLGDYILGGTSVPDQWYNLGGSMKPGALYPQALAKQLAPLSSPYYDIEISFTTAITPPALGVSWYFGTDGAADSNHVDFETTSLHELGHGLGFFATLDADDPGTGGCAVGRGCYGFDGFFGALLPGIFDTKVVACPNTHFLTPGVTGSGQSAYYGNKTTALHAALTSNNICWNGASGVAGAGGVRPKIYAPSTWEGGSSGSHLDQATYNPATNPNALMDPALPAGTAIHSPGPITTGVMADIGWTTDAPQVPTAVHATSLDGATNVSWTAPVNTGTSAITGYTVTASRLGVPVRSVTVGATTSANVTGLTNGSAYSVSVAAINTTGPGVASAPIGITPTPIATYYAAQGGSGGSYGTQLTPVTAAEGGGFVATFSGGNIYYSVATGVHGLGLQALSKFNARGGLHVLGYPTTEPFGAWPGVEAINFQNGAMYAAGAGIFVLRHVNAHYVALHGATGFLGAPTSDEVSHGGGGNVAAFVGGRMYYTVALGAHEVHGAILTEWGNLGGSAGGYGYPKSDVRVTGGVSTGRFTQFAGGNIYWSAQHRGARRARRHPRLLPGPLVHRRALRPAQGQPHQGRLGPRPPDLRARQHHPERDHRPRRRHPGLTPPPLWVYLPVPGHRQVHPERVVRGVRPRAGSRRRRCDGGPGPRPDHPRGW